MSWSGSEAQRRKEPGACMPPRERRYVVAPGMRCLVCPAGSQHWREFVTTKRIEFAAASRFVARRDGDYYEFCLTGWRMMIRQDLVQVEKR